MRAFTAVLLTLAAVATAAPSTGTDALETRQECIYSCGCSTVNGVPGNTQGCCTTAGGNYDGDRCNDLTIDQRTAFRGCCASAVCFGPRGCPL